jgi:hypothetical protein
MKLESLNSDKFSPLTPNAMQQIKGGDLRTDSGRATVNGNTFDFDHDFYCGTGTETIEYYDKDGKLLATYK